MVKDIFEQRRERRIIFLLAGYY